MISALSNMSSEPKGPRLIPIPEIKLAGQALPDLWLVHGGALG